MTELRVSPEQPVNSSYIIKLGDIDSQNPDLINTVGAKAFNLARLIQETPLRVPDGIVVTTQARKHYASDTDQIAAEVFSHLSADKRYAVRSSASAEDGHDRSFSGIFKSVLNVCPEDIMLALQEVWDSSDSDIVRSYQKNGDPEIEMAVIIQEMIDADIAGIAFSNNPVNMDPNIIHIEAVDGLGDVLASGEVTPAMYDFNRRTNELSSSSENSERPDISKIVEATSLIEETFGYPVDIEWGYTRDGNLYIFQARPITTREISENTDILNEVKNIEWNEGHIRPFNVFNSSTNWYALAYYANELLGIDDFTMLSIQKKNRDGVTTQMIRRSMDSKNRTQEEFQRLSVEDPDRLISFLEKGIVLSDRIAAIFEGKTELLPSDFHEILQFHREAFFFGALLPSDILLLDEEGKIADKRITRLAQELRTYKGFSIFFKSFVEPAAFKYFEEGGITISPEDLGNLTMEEVLERNIEGLKSRKEGTPFFIQRGLRSSVGSAYIPEEIFNITSEQQNTDTFEGKAAYMGEHVTISGTAVRLEVYMRSQRIDIPPETIIVSNNTNPALLPYLRQAIAIVTAEGGINSHAAQIAREFKIPTAVGVTNIANAVNTGDKIQIIFDQETSTARVMIIKE